MRPGEYPESERGNDTTPETWNTYRGTVAYPPVFNWQSSYPMPEATKYGNSKGEYFPLHLRDDRRPMWIHWHGMGVEVDETDREKRTGLHWYPFLSTSGFVSYPTREEAEQFLISRGYDVEDYRVQEGGQSMTQNTLNEDRRAFEAANVPALQQIWDGLWQVPVEIALGGENMGHETIQERYLCWRKGTPRTKIEQEIMHHGNWSHIKI